MYSGGPTIEEVSSHFGSFLQSRSRKAHIFWLAKRRRTSGGSGVQSSCGVFNHGGEVDERILRGVLTTAQGPRQEFSVM